MATMTMGRKAIFVLATTLLTACDPIYGVASRAHVSADLDISCVTSTLASDPAFAHAQPIGQAQMSHQGVQGKPAPAGYAWAYGEGNLSILQLTPTADGWDFSNTRVRLHAHPSAAELDRFVPVMMRINAALQAQCGLSPPSVSRS